MNTYFLTFRLEGESNGIFSDYNERYEALAAIVGQEGKPWKEPTSFYAFKSSKVATALISDIKKAINVETDIVLLIEVGHKPYYLIGKCKDASIKKIIPADNLKIFDYALSK